MVKDINDRLKMYARVINRYSIEGLLKEDYLHSVHGKSHYTQSKYLVGAFVKAAESLTLKMTSESELFRMKTRLYGIASSIERQSLRIPGHELRTLYLENWICHVRDQMQGRGILRINYAVCCWYCKAYHQIELSFEDALELKPIPQNGCKNYTGCSCEYIWKPVTDEDTQFSRKVNFLSRSN